MKIVACAICGERGPYHYYKEVEPDLWKCHTHNRLPGCADRTINLLNTKVTELEERVRELENALRLKEEESP